MPSRRTLALLSLLHATVVSTTLLAPGRQEPTAPFPRTGARAERGVCADCHDDEARLIAAAPHRGVVTSPALRECETCHGPGGAHVEDDDNDPRLITHPARLAPADQTAVCVQCHADQIRTHGGDPAGFIAAGKGCTACHRVHHLPGPARHPRIRLARRTHAEQTAQRVGAARCLECHPRRDTLLQNSHHALLAARRSQTGCEDCHGPGSLHVDSGGLARLTTRPDTAADGRSTCLGCHGHVHPTEFHWQGREKPLLSRGMTCTTCHRVHAPKDPPPPLEAADSVGRHRVDPGSGERLPGGGRGPATNRLCATCHAPALDVLKGTIHANLGRPDTPLAIGCGACHEGAERHAAFGGRADLVDSMRESSAAHQMATCNRCHGDDAALRHVAIGSHHRSEVSCLSCHSPAARAGDTRADAERRCADCHVKVAAEFRQPNHHPVLEGRMGCSDCHEPHGARPRLRDRVLTEQSCVRCHKRYRGPFVFAHQAGRSDGCVACHTPHGASNRRLLKQHTTQQNCLQCHTVLPPFHDQTPGSVFTNCLHCHTEIHGSNHSRFFFR